MASCVPPKTGALLDIAFSRVMPLILGTMAASYGCLVLNKTAFNTEPVTLTPQWQAEAAKTSGAAARLTAPAVYLNPIRSGLPGGIRGPEDVE
jgi:hypothetical protein